jgi:Trp operon repressor
MLLTHTLTMPERNTASASAQIETQISDAEVSQRVLHIRSGWSVAERIQRRREAQRRFADLVSRLAPV